MRLDHIVVRDVRERGRDIEGCIKQWFAFVKPNFHKYVEVQRDVAGLCNPSEDMFTILISYLDIIVPRGIENQVAIGLWFPGQHQSFTSDTL